MTPFSDPSNNKEKRYNFSHAQVRNCVERGFGILKMRWMILKGQINLHLPTAIDVITACFVLHNMLRGQRDCIDEGQEMGGMIVPSTAVPDEDEGSEGQQDQVWGQVRARRKETEMEEEKER